MRSAELSTVHIPKKGVLAALSSALCLGLAPVFGRMAILYGIPSLAVVAIRTTLAALLLLIAVLIFGRKYLYIYPAGLLGCLLAGWINGFGSLFYYFALSRINASLGQLLFSLYPLFLVLWLSLDRQAPSKLTILRLGLALPAIILIVGTEQSKPDLLGAGAMLIAAILYALHLPINQRVLYDMPPQTVTLYTLMAMSAVVLPPFLFSNGGGWIGAPFQGGSAAHLGVSPAQMVAPLIGLTLVTFFSRLMLFTGVKHLGGMQTALLGLGELLVTLVFAQIFLDETLTTTQWAGAGLLMASLMMVGLEGGETRRGTNRGFLRWLSPITYHESVLPAQLSENGSTTDL